MTFRIRDRADQRDGILQPGAKLRKIVTRELGLQDVEVDDQRRENLTHAVVKLPRQLLAFGFLHFDQVPR